MTTTATTATATATAASHLYHDGVCCGADSDKSTGILSAVTCADCLDWFATHCRVVG